MRIDVTMVEPTHACSDRSRSRLTWTHYLHETTTQHLILDLQLATKEQLKLNATTASASCLRCILD